MAHRREGGPKLSAVLSKEIKQWPFEAESYYREELPSYVTYVSIIDRLCDHQNCSVFTPEGLPMLFDGNHFTLAGASFVWREVELLSEDSRLRSAVRENVRVR
jgi:hypothetical protein